MQKVSEIELWSPKNVWNPNRRFEQRKIHEKQQQQQQQQKKNNCKNILCINVKFESCLLSQ